MLKKITGVFLFLMSVTFVQAQTYERTKTGLKATVNSVVIQIEFYSPSTVRIVKVPQGTIVKKESLSVTKELETIKLTTRVQNSVLSLSSNTVQAHLNLKTGKISFSSSSGESLLAEKEGTTKFTDFSDAGSKTYNVYQAFALDKDEAIYGLGQLQNGKMIQRNLRKNLIQGNTEDVITFFQSVKGYGLFWDNYSPTLFVDNNQETSFKSEVGDCVDYYFMYGGNADGVIAQMRILTGKAPMFPLWTYGLCLSSV